MLIAAILTIAAFLRAFLIQETTSPYLPSLIGIPHVIILAFLAYRTPVEFRTLAGTQLQTAGYLHTLVGFSVLLTILGLTSSFEPSIVLGPLGSALITSLVGWFFGGELTGRNAAGEDEALRTEAARVTEELRGFAAGVRSVHEEYFRVIRGLLTEHVAVDEAHRKAFRRVTELSTALDGHLTTIVKTLATFEATVSKAAESIDKSFGDEFRKRVSATAGSLKSVNEELANVATQARDSAKYLRDSRILIEELSNLAEMLGLKRGTVDGAKS